VLAGVTPSAELYTVSVNVSPVPHWYGTAGVVPLAWGVMLTLTLPSDDVRFRVAALADVYPMVTVKGALPLQFG
jgi:hypothetical protein